MRNIYTRPVRVYILLGALALWGILSGLQLPVSLFPNSNQITISANVPTGPFSSQQFFDVYGRELESQLQGLQVEGIRVKELKSDYRTKNTNYRIQFDWGAKPERALDAVKTLILSQLSGVDEEIRRGISVNSWSENRGFFAVSFYSPLRSLDELYLILEPLITPIQSDVADANNLGLWNPNRKEITIALSPEKLAQFEITTQQISRSIQSSLIGRTGGNIRLGDKNYIIDLPKGIDQFEKLAELRVSPRGKTPIFLKDVAKITSGISADSRQKFKTSGTDSLILFGEPKEGGNIKRMSDQIMQKLKLLEAQWPADVQYRILVNPSEFINRSIKSVIHEVLLAALLAVLVLFLFIGSFKNVITAAIEIPLSLLMAFILMRLSGMNLNLISLGGLALSAGMNVDASVVVLENIVRHFELAGEKLSYREKVDLVLKAVSEVRLPIIASTLASLVVFFPLIFTEGLTHSLLGDLAKAVIFSHGLSAIVALILVPTIRLQILGYGGNLESKSPIESGLRKLESLYQRSLTQFLNHKSWQWFGFLGGLLLLPLLLVLVLPRLEKEVIGKPDSEWLFLGVSSPTFNNLKQMESEFEELDQSILKNFGDEVLYTFTQINGPQEGSMLIRMKHKDQIEKNIQKAEEFFKNTPTKSYVVDYWNPSELSIPDPPQFRVNINDGSPTERLKTAQNLQALFLEKGIFDKVRVLPTANKEKEIRFESFFNPTYENEILSREELSHYLRTLTDGVYVDQIFQKQEARPIYLRLDQHPISSTDELKAIPIGYQGKLLPLGALGEITMQERSPRIYRENQKSMISLSGRLNKNQMSFANDRKFQASELLKEVKSKQNAADKDQPLLTEVQPDLELQQSLEQLYIAVAISILLVFLTMVLQFGDIIHSLLVLVSIPLGVIGVLISLFIFKSTLSLNSGLGTILLNGIAVANSIILVDFIRKLHQNGLDAKTATIEASVARLRPILMTSLTTVLGMLPVALGLGEGGKILQPLGIAVCGGLWVSTLLTLYFVPALQYIYLHRQESR